MRLKLLGLCLNRGRDWIKYLLQRDLATSNPGVWFFCLCTANFNTAILFSCCWPGQSTSRQTELTLRMKQLLIVWQTVLNIIPVACDQYLHTR